VDFKTTAQTPNPDRVAHQTEIQLSCYAVLYREATGKLESGFELHHLVKVKVPSWSSLRFLPSRITSRPVVPSDGKLCGGGSSEDFVPSPGSSASVASTSTSVVVGVERVGQRCPPTKLNSKQKGNLCQ